MKTKKQCWLDWDLPDTISYILVFLLLFFSYSYIGFELTCLVIASIIIIELFNISNRIENDTDFNDND